MKQMIFFLMLMAAGASTGLMAQEPLPVKQYAAKDTHLPLVVYISGDGGWNNFTSSLETAINKKGYALISLNSRSYFWEKKLPTVAARELADYLNRYLAQHSHDQIIFMGYSFGADVLPFILKELPPGLLEKIKGALLLAPSSSTDFEIHLSDMLGIGASRGMKVADGINALSIDKIVAVFGAEDHDFPLDQIRNRHFSSVSLPGGHHFEGNTEDLVTILQTKL